MTDITLPASQITLSDADFERFRDYFYRKTGIDFDLSRRYFVDRRLIERIAALGLDSFRDYFMQLRNGNEIEHLINIMTVNESYFFREEYQFRCLVQSMLPELLARKNGAPIRIWSMPCASGEEPFSLALYLMTHWPALETHDVELLASDIDTQALAAAREGIFSERAVKQLPAALRQRYFEPFGEERYRLDADVRDCVAFSHVNIVDAAQVAAIGAIDVVFCRNLLIYFDDVSRRLAAANLFDSLNPGGFICLGHSESMSRISSLFNVRKFPDAIVYQKGLNA
ncbi:protein-glutamate O-methyltransferase CheR [Andreprevotia sp. IGB-42]|uniref:CheR family methyltransferase n=1 Tax=Andreprevotia sp. IGB-42 TaxID=2497473 RepID=UPI00135B045A|nr:protein-glutamate O-methyltransferase CheR [Andreprevotia sp. IGB-42]